jgi:hypothetical protein
MLSKSIVKEVRMVKCAFHPIYGAVRFDCFLGAGDGVELHKRKYDPAVLGAQVDVDGGAELAEKFAQVFLGGLNHEKGVTSVLRFEMYIFWDGLLSRGYLSSIAPARIAIYYYFEISLPLFI